MAFLTFAEAKVVAPPLLPRKYRAHTVQYQSGTFPRNLNRKKEKKEKTTKLYKIKKPPPLREGPNEPLNS